MKLLDQKREQQQLVGKLTNQLELAELVSFIISVV
jgi:hypothetical protein